MKIKTLGISILGLLLVSANHASADVVSTTSIASLPVGMTLTLKREINLIPNAAKFSAGEYVHVPFFDTTFKLSFILRCELTANCAADHDRSILPFSDTGTTYSLEQGVSSKAMATSYVEDTMSWKIIGSTTFSALNCQRLDDQGNPFSLYGISELSFGHFQKALSKYFTVTLPATEITN